MFQTTFVSPRLKLRKPADGVEAEDAFSAFEIADDSFLEEVESRSQCDLCSRSRRFFCYTCHVALPSIRDRVPKVDLPIDVHVVKHPGEIDGKSTAVHAALVARDRVKMFTWPDFPDYPNDGSVVVVFPKKAGQQVPELKTSMANVTTAIFLDSTWKQTKRLINDPKLINLPRVALEPIDTLFWRYQNGVPRTYLATIEAIYYFLRQTERERRGLSEGVEEEYDGRYDNLLFFFRFMYRKLHELYGSDNLKAYKPRDGRDLRFWEDKSAKK